jgi:hypothetical protein
MLFYSNLQFISRAGSYQRAAGIKVVNTGRRPSRPNTVKRNTVNMENMVERESVEEIAETQA